MADCETVVCHTQSAQEVPISAAALGLTATERVLLPALRRGIALWHVGTARYLVEHLISPIERRFVDTDAALIDRGAQSERKIT